MDTKGGKLRWGGDGGVLNWVIGIDMFTLMCIKLMTNKKKRITERSIAENPLKEIKWNIKINQLTQRRQGKTKE